MQYRDSPEMLEMIREVGAMANMGPSEVIGRLLRFFLEIKADSADPAMLDKSKTYFLIGVLSALGLPSKPEMFQALLHALTRNRRGKPDPPSEK